jgi:hypothetical protein
MKHDDNATLKNKKPSKRILVGVSLPSEDADIFELVKAAVRGKFAPNMPEVFRRCARLHLMQVYGDNKKVQCAIEKIRQDKIARGFAQ